jgi:hypothetical protein
MKLHPREQLVMKERHKLERALLDFMESDVTDAEYISVLSDVFGTAIATRAKYMIRRERHGNTDKPGGLE